MKQCQSSTTKMKPSQSSSQSSISRLPAEHKPISWAERRMLTADKVWRLNAEVYHKSSFLGGNTSKSAPRPPICPHFSIPCYYMCHVQQIAAGNQLAEENCQQAEQSPASQQAAKQSQSSTSSEEIQSPTSSEANSTANKQWNNLNRQHPILTKQAVKCTAV